MKAGRVLPSILLATSVLLAPAANSAGMIMIDPMPGMPVPPVVRPLPVRPGPVTPRPGQPPLLRGSVMFGLRLQSADIKVDIQDQVAKTYVTQTFVNDTDRDVAGTYLFPLPDDTTFSSFSLHIDGKPIEGKILEAQEARQQYEEIVRRMVDPGLLEYADYKTVRARIFPIPAHGTKKVELEYTQLLKADGGLVKYRFPLKTEGAGEAEEINVRVKLNSKQGLRTIWSPSHTVTTDRDGDHAAKIAFLGKDAVPDKDFFLYYSLSDKDLTANLLTNKMVGEDGYYLLSLAPPVESKEIAAKDIVLVADTSGSMQGDRMEQNKKAMKYLVNALSAQDKFSIVQFNTDVDSFKTELIAATPENKKLALAYIDDLEAHGGTNIADALKTGITILDAAQANERPGYLIMMTDGEPTVGETSVSGLLKLVNSKRDIRVFDFGVGYDVNTKLLNKLAEEHHGTAHYVEPEETIEASLSEFYNKIKSPMLTDVKIAYEGIQVKDIYPRAVKDIFAGSQLLLLGRYKGEGDATVKLTGTVNGVAKAYTFPVKFAAAEADNTYLPRLWAMRRIGHLTDVAKENGDNREVVDEIVDLSKKHGIITAYTSFLVTDPNESNRRVNRGGVITPVPGEPMMLMEGDEAGSSTGTAGMDSVAAGPRVEAMMNIGRPRRNAAGGGSGLIAPPPPASLMGALPPTNMGAFVHQPGSVMHSASPASGRMIGSAKKAESVRFYNAPRSLQFADSTPVVMDLRAQLRAAGETGKKAVELEKQVIALKEQTSLQNTDDKAAAVKQVGGKTFQFRDGFWIDSAYNDKTSPKVEDIEFGSNEYFELLKMPGVSKYLSVGRQVLFVHNNRTFKIIFKEKTA